MKRRCRFFFLKNETNASVRDRRFSDPRTPWPSRQRSPAVQKRLRPPPNPRLASRPRRKAADQRLRILGRLTSGLSVVHIARVEKLTVRRVQQIIAAMLESREIGPPAGFVQLQVARISEAMIVSHTMMMMEGDLQAIDRMIGLTRELDRCHGFAQATVPPEPPAPRRLAAPERRPQLSNSTRRSPGGKFSASQPLEIAENRERISEISPPPE
jgi:hypothetical protein